NPRFGFKGMSPLTPIEYIFIFIGLYYLFKNKESHRYLISGLLLIAPVTAALAWQENSITRSFYMTIPITILVAYGLHQISLSQKNYLHRYLLIGAICLTY